MCNGRVNQPLCRAITEGHSERGKAGAASRTRQGRYGVSTDLLGIALALARNGTDIPGLQGPRCLAASRKMQNYCKL